MSEIRSAPPKSVPRPVRAMRVDRTAEQHVVDTGDEPVVVQLQATPHGVLVVRREAVVRKQPRGSVRSGPGREPGRVHEQLPHLRGICVQEAVERRWQGDVHLDRLVAACGGERAPQSGSLLEWRAPRRFAQLGQPAWSRRARRGPRRRRRSRSGTARSGRQRTQQVHLVALGGKARVRRRLASGRRAGAATAQRRVSPECRGVRRTDARRRAPSCRRAGRRGSRRRRGRGSGASSAASRPPVPRGVARPRAQVAEVPVGAGQLSARRGRGALRRPK